MASVLPKQRLQKSISRIAALFSYIQLYTDNSLYHIISDLLIPQSFVNMSSFHVRYLIAQWLSYFCCCCNNSRSLSFFVFLSDWITLYIHSLSVLPIFSMPSLSFYIKRCLWIVCLMIWISWIKVAISNLEINLFLIFLTSSSVICRYIIISATSLIFHIPGRM